MRSRAIGHGVAVCCAIAGVIAAPRLAAAQTQTSGLRATVAATTSFDDNVMSSPTPTADMVIRVTPGIGFSHSKERLTWSADYSSDAERYQNRSDLSTAQARQGLNFTSSFKASPRTTFSWTGTFASTTNPAELNPLTGLNVGRVKANQWQGGTTVRHRISERTDATVAYSFQLSSGRALGRSQSHGLDMRLAYRPTKHTETFFRVDGQRFAFGSMTTPPSTSTSLDGGWAFHGKLATFSVEAGAQVAQGHVGPRVVLSLLRAFGATSVTASYTRSVTTAVGLSTTVAFDSVQSTVTYRRRGGAPDRALVIRARGVVSRNRVLSQELNVLQYGVDVVKPFGRAVSFVASYDGSSQHTPALVTGLVGGDIVRNRMSVTLAITPWSARR